MESIRQDFDRDLANAASSADYEQLKVAYLGKKGRVTELFKELKNVEPSQKKEAGQLINTLRAEVEKKLAAGAEKCRQAEEERLVNEAEAYDFTRPAEAEQGSLHPITLVQREVEEIFASMGFTIEDYLEVVDEYKNFESLNIPKHHPARDMQDLSLIHICTRSGCCAALCGRCARIKCSSPRWPSVSLPPLPRWSGAPPWRRPWPPALGGRC